MLYIHISAANVSAPSSPHYSRHMELYGRALEEDKSLEHGLELCSAESVDMAWLRLTRTQVTCTGPAQDKDN